MNTPQDNWEKEKFEELYKLMKRGYEPAYQEGDIEEYKNELKSFVKSIRTSRDTYWKERVNHLLIGARHTRRNCGCTPPWCPHNKIIDDLLKALRHQFTIR